tara:strand:- start:134 stop:610 length:477 start_codon:yes stop_codon:yes gene_type:complete
MNFKYITKTTIAIAALIGSFNLESLTTDNSQLLLVHKTATCGCCKQWIKHLEKNGFSISTKDHQSLQDIKESYQIKSEYRSCHTGVSKDGYIFEGHIPSKYITQFLSEEHSNAIGLSVPGMPLGSPGMEFEGKFMPYDVLILFKDGTSKVYAKVSRRN